MSKAFIIFILFCFPCFGDHSAIDQMTFPKQPFNKQSPIKSSVSPPFFQDIIVIDPGHGGKDTGAKSLGSPVYLEKRLTFVTSQYLKKALELLGYRPLLTRSSDHSLSLGERVEFAKARNADIFVSIHFNSAPNTDAKGIEVYYFQSSDKYSRTKASKELANDILKRSIDFTGARSRKVKHGDYFVIREITLPSVLVEGGFLTNAEEMELLKKPSYLKKLAVGIARGIDDYLTKHRSSKR